MKIKYFNKLNKYLLFFLMVNMSACFDDVSLTEEERKVIQDQNTRADDVVDNPSAKTKSKIYLYSTSSPEGDQGENKQLVFSIRLSHAQDKTILLKYKITPILAQPAVDYVEPKDNQITIEPNTTKAYLAIDLIGNNTVGATKNIELTFTKVESDNAELAVFNAEGIIANDDKPNRIRLLDTGNTLSVSADGKRFSNKCDIAGQNHLDCSHGADGVLSRKYTKYDSDGKALPANTTTWACVKDELTGRYWEAKQDTPYKQLYSKNALYDYYDSQWFDVGENHWPFVTTGLNRVFAGFPLSKLVYNSNTNSYGPINPEDIFAVRGAKQCHDQYRVCTSEKYALDVNKDKLCGFEDWRVPEIDELHSLKIVNGGAEYDQNYFPYLESKALLSITPKINYKQLNNFSFLLDDVEARHPWYLGKLNGKKTNRLLMLVRGGSE